MKKTIVIVASLLLGTQVQAGSWSKKDERTGMTGMEASSQNSSGKARTVGLSSLNSSKKDRAETEENENEVKAGMLQNSSNSTSQRGKDTQDWFENSSDSTSGDSRIQNMDDSSDSTSGRTQEGMQGIGKSSESTSNRGEEGVQAIGDSSHNSSENGISAGVSDSSDSIFATDEEAKQAIINAKDVAYFANLEGFSLGDELYVAALAIDYICSQKYGKTNYFETSLNYEVDTVSEAVMDLNSQKTITCL